jgi:hypothetical protein
MAQSLLDALLGFYTWPVHILAMKNSRTVRLLFRAPVRYAWRGHHGGELA